jgi:hypothetical protein
MPIQIVAYGDDAMEGITVSTDSMPSLVTPNEPAALQLLLQQQFSDPNISVLESATGETAGSLMNLLDGMDGGGPPFTQLVASSSAEIVLDNHAVNDALGGESPTDY